MRELRATLADHGHEAWIAPRELQAGNLLWSELQRAIDEASAFAVVVSPAALQSTWVGKELRYALDIQKQRGKDNFPVIPLSLNGTKLGVLEEFFSEQPLYIPVSSGADDDPAPKSAALLVLMATLENSTHPKVLANCSLY